MNRFLKYFTGLAMLSCLIVSCETPDMDKTWGNALIYMPQAMYNPYVVPNNGTHEQNNLNYSIDEQNDLLNIFLGVYRSGLQDLEEYTVDVSVDNVAIKGTTLLPPAYYDIPIQVTCPAGKRDVTFYVTVDLNWLKANRSKDYSLDVIISNPTKYDLNESICRTTLRLNSSELLTKEGL